MTKKKSEQSDRPKHPILAKRLSEIEETANEEGFIYTCLLMDTKEYYNVLFTNPEKNKRRTYNLRRKNYEEKIEKDDEEIKRNTCSPTFRLKGLRHRGYY